MVLKYAVHSIYITLTTRETGEIYYFKTSVLTHFCMSVYYWNKCVAYLRFFSKSLCVLCYRLCSLHDHHFKIFIFSNFHVTQRY